MIRKAIFIFILTSFFACGDYAALEQNDVNKRKADSLFNDHKDSLVKELKPLCDSIYAEIYDSALDSIKKEQLEKIIELTQ